MKTSKLLFLVLAAGILTRIVLWCCQSNAAGDDGERYYRESQNLVEYGVFSSEIGTPPSPTAHDLPLWPTTMSGILWLTGSKAITTYIAGIFNLALMCGATFFLLSLLAAPPFNCGTKGKILAAAVLLFSPESIPYSLFYMPDTMALFFLCGALKFFFKGIYVSKKWLIGATLMFSAAVLAKPICLPVSIAFIFSLLLILPTPFLRRCAWVLACLALLTGSMLPWYMRNKQAFGTPGLTTISGTNLYGCNWGWMVNSWPESKRIEALEQNKAIEARAEEFDLMRRSKILGTYAKDQILTHWGDYLLFTIKRHPRLYCGTGTVALFRYLGAEGCCTAITKSTQDGQPSSDFTRRDSVIAWSIQYVSLALLAAIYLIIICGIVSGACAARASGRLFSMASVAFFAALGGMLLLALVIGPITATRYRFIMLPFFALMASFAYFPKRRP